MKIRWINRYDPSWPKLRLLRILWGRAVGDKASHKLSINLRPRLFEFTREWKGWRLTLLGVNIHHAWSYGGNFC